MMVVSSLEVDEGIIRWGHINESDVADSRHLLKLLQFILLHCDQAVLEFDDLVVGVKKFTLKRGLLRCIPNICFVNIGFEVASSGEAQGWGGCHWDGKVEVYLFLGLGQRLKPIKSIGWLVLLTKLLELFQKVV